MSTWEPASPSVSRSSPSLPLPFINGSCAILTASPRAGSVQPCFEAHPPAQSFAISEQWMRRSLRQSRAQLGSRSGSSRGGLRRRLDRRLAMSVQAAGGSKRGPDLARRSDRRQLTAGVRKAPHDGLRSDAADFRAPPSEPRGAFTNVREGETLEDARGARLMRAAGEVANALWRANRDLIDRDDSPLAAGMMLRTP